MKLDHSSSVETPDAVDVLVAEYLDALDHGHAPSRSDWIAQHPEHAEALGRFFDDLERLSPVAATKNPYETQMLSGVTPRSNGKPHDPETLGNAPSVRSDLERTVAEEPFGGSFGDYDLLDTIARGGMGVVFKARHRQLGRVVALKMILAGQLADVQHVQRFRSEAQAAAKLDHPGIVQVFEVGEQQGLHYFTMAFVDGKSLADRLRDGPIPPKEAARLVRDLAAAIAYAHEHGIVHRDLKPANVLIDAKGQPKLTDFGLAKHTHDATELTRTGQILGTPAYMAPEQAQGGTASVGPAADVYGLGALLFALLTGRPPFQGATLLETIQHVVSAEPVRPRMVNPSVPRDLETISLKCLEKSPAKRYASAADLQRDLDRFLDDRPILARPVGVIEKAYRWYRRRPLLGTMAASLTLLLIAVPVLLGGFLIEAEGRADAEKGRANAEAEGRIKEKDAREQVEKAHKKTKAAERERTRQLFQAYVNEAAAKRTSPRLGRHFDSMARIIAARELADELRLPLEDYVRMRSEAIGALSLVDLQPARTGPGWYISQEPISRRFVGPKDCYLSWDMPNALLVRRLSDRQIVQRIPVDKAGREHGDPWLSPDNRFVVRHHNDHLVLWRVDGEKPVEMSQRNDVRWAHFAPDRPELIVYTKSRDFVVVPLEGIAEPRTIRIPAIAKAPDTGWNWPRFLTGPRGQIAVPVLKRVLLADLDTGKVTGSFDVPGEVQDLAWSSDGKTVAASFFNQGVLFLEPGSRSVRSVKTTFHGPERIAFDPSGTFLLTVNWWTGHSTLLNVATATMEQRFHITELTGHAHLGDGDGVRLRGSLDSLHRMVSLDPTDGQPFEIAIHPDGRILASATTRGILLTDLATGKRLQFLPLGMTRFPRFDDGGNLFFFGHQGGVNSAYRCPITAKRDRYFVGAVERLPLPPTHGIDVSANGRWVASSTYEGCVVLDRETGEKRDLKPYENARDVAMTRDGALAAAIGYHAEGFRVWNARTGKLVHIHSKGNHGAGRFSPDGKYLVVRATGQDLMVWPTTDWNASRSLGSNGNFAISPDSRYVAIAEHAGKIRLMRIADSAMIGRFDAPAQDYPNHIAFSPDGRFLAASNVDGSMLHIWDLWKLRRQLAELKLDWEKDAPPDAPPSPVQIQVEVANTK